MKFVAVTSCPIGIAHSQMGAEDELTSEEIAEADAVIIAADTSVSRDRFAGKPVVKYPVAKAINEGEELIEEAVEKAENGAGSSAESSGNSNSCSLDREHRTSFLDSVPFRFCRR